MKDRWYNPPCRVWRETFIGWESPPFGWYALNTDGASKQNPGLAEGGGVLIVLQGWNCEWLGGFAERMGVCSSASAKLRAVFKAFY